jgi:ribonuclease Z
MKMNMKVVFLGTSSATPTPERGLSSIVVVRGGELLVFDAGEGMQRNFIKASLGMNKKMKVFISHIHADHCVGLLGLLQTMALQGRERSVDIYGGPKVQEFINENMRIINFGLSFEVNVHVIDKDGVVAKEKDYEVRCCTARHSVPSFAYCLHEYDRPGRFDLEAAKQLGIPEGELYGKLQHGEDVFHGGRLLKSSQIVGPSRRGRKIGISGDTRPTEELIGFFQGCDVLVFESTYSEDKKQKAVENWHSTATEAATVAKNAGVGKLFLTHFSARYEETSALVREASLIHRDVEAAEDLMSHTIPYSS